MSAGVHGEPHLVDGAHAAGGGFVVHHTKGPDRPVPVLPEALLDGAGVGAAAPVSGNELWHEAEADGQVLPQGGEVAGLDHQHPVPRGQGVDQRGLPCAGAGGRVDHHPAGGPEDPLHPRQDPAPQSGEARTAMVHGGMVHGPENAVRDVGRSRNLEKMTTGVLHGSETRGRDGI